jgi:hypothetical protein
MFFFFRKSRQRLTETILDRRGLFTLPHCSLQIDLITGQHIFPNSTVWLTIFELPHDDVRVVVLFGKSFFDTKKDTQKSLEERNSTYHTTTIVCVWVLSYLCGVIRKIHPFLGILLLN